MRAAALVFGLLLSACAAKPPPAGPPPVVLATTCRYGPHCVTGQIGDLTGDPIAGVKCVVLGPLGEPFYVYSDARGVFFTDRLPAPPREIRFEKAGYAAQVVPVPAQPVRSAARLYINLHRLTESECTCEPNALVGGLTPCPPERCH